MTRTTTPALNGIERLQHPRFARMWLGMAKRADLAGGAGHRARLLAGLTGTVIEVGAGQGRNFPHYPDTVTAVVAVEPDHTLRGHAEHAARRVPTMVTVMPGHADDLPAPPGMFDAAVASLVLCSVPRPATALAEIRRVLRPNGTLHFYEHVRSPSAGYGRVQDVITPVWSRLGGGCHPNRDTVEAIESAGFHIEQLNRVSFKPAAYLPPITHVIGRARR
jgi:SAM-dependent methyltransferase